MVVEDSKEFGIENGKEPIRGIRTIGGKRKISTNRVEPLLSKSRSNHFLGGSLNPLTPQKKV